MKKSLLLSIIITLFNAQVMSAETCSRTATINYQEVLVDTNSTQKGEGLRYHLEKDPVALSYLNSYQKGTEINWTNAAIGTVGSSLIIGGLLNSDSDTKKNLLISGATLIAINFLVARTLEKSNEQNLEKAIEEYNKRNLPRIYFEKNKNDPSKNSLSFLMNKSWSF